MITDFRPQICAVDVETKMTEHYRGKDLLGVAVAWQEGDELKSTYFLPTELDTCREFIQGAEWIFHNAAFDLRILAENGIHLQPGQVFWDTMIMAHLTNENRYSFDLDSLAKFMLKEEKTDMKPFIKIFGHWDKIPVEIMGPYAEQDVRLTYRLYTILRGELEKQDLVRVVWKHSRETILTLVRVMSVGIPIDVELCRSLSADALSEMASIEKNLGFEPTKPKQLADHLFRGFVPTLLTPTGKPKLDDASLRYYASKYPETQDLILQILRYRKLMKARSTWYEGFQDLMTPEGTLHPGLKQHGTKTGRLSCARPNLQQMPRDATRVKKVFLAYPNHTLIEFDYSQIELRLGGFYLKKMFKDPLMFDTYVEGADIHQLTTDRIGASDRTAGKVGNFLWLYGGSYKRFRAMMYDQWDQLVSVHDAQRWTEGFHETYPGIRAALAHFDKLAKKQGYVKIWSGRRRHFGRNEETYKAWNSVIQGGCGQILLMSMNQIRHLQERGIIKSEVCNTVHDSLWVMVPNDRLEEEMELIKKAMRVIPESTFGLPFEVDSKILSERSLVSA